MARQLLLRDDAEEPQLLRVHGALDALRVRRVDRDQVSAEAEALHREVGRHVLVGGALHSGASPSRWSRSGRGVVAIGLLERRLRDALHRRHARRHHLTPRPDREAERSSDLQAAAEGGVRLHRLLLERLEHREGVRELGEAKERRRHLRDCAAAAGSLACGHVGVDRPLEPHERLARVRYGGGARVDGSALLARRGVEVKANAVHLEADLLVPHLQATQGREAAYVRPCLRERARARGEGMGTRRTPGRRFPGSRLTLSQPGVAIRGRRAPTVPRASDALWPLPLPPAEDEGEEGRRPVVAHLLGYLLELLIVVEAGGGGAVGDEEDALVVLVLANVLAHRVRAHAQRVHQVRPARPLLVDGVERGERVVVHGCDLVQLDDVLVVVAVEVVVGGEGVARASVPCATMPTASLDGEDLGRDEVPRGILHVGQVRTHALGDVDDDDEALLGLNGGTRSKRAFPRERAGTRKRRGRGRVLQAAVRHLHFPGFGRSAGAGHAAPRVGGRGRLAALDMTKDLEPWSVVLSSRSHASANREAQYV